MSEHTYRVELASNEYQDVATRYAAELIDATTYDPTYEQLVEMLAVAYLQGGCDQLKWARDKMRGDGE